MIAHVKTATESALAMQRRHLLECEAATASLLSVLVRTEPNEAWLDQLASGKLFDSVPFAADDGEMVRGRQLMDRWAQAWRAGEGSSRVDALYADYMTLFVGPGAPCAAPWESVQTHGDEALVFQQETLDVRERYREFGLQVERLHHEPDDHIGYEIEFVAALARLEADALAEGNATEAARAASARAAFLEDHLTRWAPRWAASVLEHAKTDFFRGVAHLVKGFVLSAA